MRCPFMKSSSAVFKVWVHATLTHRYILFLVVYFSGRVIAVLLSTHQCNMVCQYLNLPNVLGAPIKVGAKVPVMPALLSICKKNKSSIFEGCKDRPHYQSP